MSADIRWKQRLENYERAVALLREPVERGVMDLSDLEQEGTIQRFEVVLELAWKTLKDYLEYSGQVILPLTPREVIRRAFGAGILKDGQLWIDMLDHRSRLSHTYDSSLFEKAARDIQDRYYSELESLCEWMKTR